MENQALLKKRTEYEKIESAIMDTALFNVVAILVLHGKYPVLNLNSKYDGYVDAFANGILLNKVISDNSRIASELHVVERVERNLPTSNDFGDYYVSNKNGMRVFVGSEENGIMSPDYLCLELYKVLPFSVKLFGKSVLFNILDSPTKMVKIIKVNKLQSVYAKDLNNLLLTLYTLRPYLIEIFYAVARSLHSLYDIEEPRKYQVSGVYTLQRAFEQPNSVMEKSTETVIKNAMSEMLFNVNLMT